ncbi:CRISPR-associated protein Cas5 [Streptomyces sp. M19]
MGRPRAFNRRESGSEPTKSGVVGLLAAAVGLDRGRPSATCSTCAWASAWTSPEPSCGTTTRSATTGAVRSSRRASPPRASSGRPHRPSTPM